MRVDYTFAERVGNPWFVFSFCFFFFSTEVEESVTLKKSGLCLLHEKPPAALQRKGKLYRIVSGALMILAGVEPERRI